MVRLWEQIRPDDWLDFFLSLAWKLVIADLILIAGVVSLLCLIYFRESRKSRKNSMRGAI